jgi:hypothetical protein
MIWDMATAIKRELRELVASGCTVIQIEEPTIHFIACHYPELKYVNLENLVVTSDYGYGRQGTNRLVAFYKTAATAQGANIIRREHGLPETYVPVLIRD